MNSRQITPHKASLLVAEGRLMVRPVDGRLVLESAERRDESSIQGDAARRFFADVVALADRITPLAKATASVGADRFIAEVPEAAIRWLTDPVVVYELLAGNITAAEDEFTGARTRRVEVDTTNPEAFADAARNGRLWVCRAEWRGDSGETFRSSWLVEDRNDDESSPSQQLGRSLHRLRDSLIALGGDGCRVGIARKGASSVNDVDSPGANQRIIRIVTEAWTAYWPSGSLRGTLALIAGGGNPQRSTEDPVTIDSLLEKGAFRIVCSSIGRNGPAALSYRRPRTPAERRSGYATATIARLVTSGYSATQRLVDSAYRSGDRFALFVTIYRYSGATWRTAFDKALGSRRRDALPQEPSPTQRTAGPDGRTLTTARRASIWDQYAVAVEGFVDLFATQIHRPGGAIDASIMDIVSRYYLRPRTDAIRAVWERTCRDTRIDTLLEEGRLSILRDIGRRYPRTTLVEAVAGRPATTKRRIASIFSRNGRAIFLEDVEAIEAAIARRDPISWERLLSSQGILSKIAQRIQA
jgi:hypothetical protein